MRRLLRTLTLAAFLCPTAASAAETGMAHVVVDAASGAVLDARAATAPWYPASLVKLMTAFVALRAVRGGELRLEDKTVVSAAAAAQPARKLWLSEGRRITVTELLGGAVTYSANDAAVALAEAVAGSEAKFVRRMQATARGLGMDGTRFVNATGLPDRDSRTTARDMALLMRALVTEFPDRLSLFSREAVRVGRRWVNAATLMMATYDGVEAVKTGFTCWSGYNIAMAARRDDRRLIAVVLGGRSSGLRNDRTARLLNAAFRAAGGPDSAGAPRSLAALNGSAGTPPEVLSPADCGVAQGLRTAAVTATPLPRARGKLPGWGVLLGAFKDRDAAEAAIGRGLGLLEPGLRRGRRTVLPTTRKPIKRHLALLTGLGPGDVKKICTQLRERRAFCLGLSPDTLNNERAVWR